MPTDILMIQTLDGGDLAQSGNDLILTDSLENQIPLYLFGGNIEQDTKEGNSDNFENSDWWGNSVGFDENFNSKFERTLREVVLNSSGVQKLINAAKADLSPLSEFAEIEIDGEVPKTNQFRLIVNLKIPQKPSEKTVYLFEGGKVIDFDYLNHGKDITPIGFNQNQNIGFTENTEEGFTENIF